MKKSKITVPSGIRFMSEWKDFIIPDYPCIMDKKIPGCGFTEYCLTNSENVILCSPRKLLLRNKEKQHLGEVLYVNNSLDQDETTDKDLEKFNRSSGIVPTKLTDITPEATQQEIIENLKNLINTYSLNRRVSGFPVKIIVTYDSFRIVKETLGDRIKDFRIVIDEFQSIFTDSRFKSDTELTFMYHLQDLQKVCYVSATPMIDEYLEKLDEFKDLPYIELDWESEDPCRVLKPDLKVRTCKSVNEPAYKIIKEYLDGNFESISYKDEQGNIRIVESREAVFFVNSVINIVGIINKCKLKPEQCNILVADTPDNKKKLKKRLGSKWEIGEPPLLGEPHKMFTFCTRTVYLGADFYSTNARTIVISDANVETLSVDISLDLPQILGRQRNNENPWKNRAEFYYKTSKRLLTKEEFNKYLDIKIRKTNELLSTYDTTEFKHTLAEKYKKDTNASNYKDDYVSINEHSGRDMFPELNRLVLIAEQRAFDIQQIDYKDRFTVFNTLVKNGLISKGSEVSRFIEDFNTLPSFNTKMKALCESGFGEYEMSAILDQVPKTYKTFYLVLGPGRCRANGYDVTRVRREYEDIVMDKGDMKREIYRTFEVGKIYSNKDAKNKLTEIYNSYGYNKVPKANDLEGYFKVVRARKTVDGVRVEGLKILEKL